MREISDEDLNHVVELAFKRGESWGVCYSSWFSATESDTNIKIGLARKAAKRYLARKPKPKELVV